MVRGFGFLVFATMPKDIGVTLGVFNKMNILSKMCVMLDDGLDFYSKSFRNKKKMVRRIVKKRERREAQKRIDLELRDREK